MNPVCDLFGMAFFDGLVNTFRTRNNNNKYNVVIVFTRIIVQEMPRCLKNSNTWYGTSYSSGMACFLHTILNYHNYLQTEQY